MTGKKTTEMRLYEQLEDVRKDLISFYGGISRIEGMVSVIR